MRTDVIARFAEIATRLNPVELVTPTNERALAQEYKKAFSEGIVLPNPKFEFDTEKLRTAAEKLDELKQIKEEFLNLLIELPPVKHFDRRCVVTVNGIIIRRLNDAIITARLAQAMLDNDALSAGECVKSKYGVPSSTAICMAHDVYHRGNKDSDTLVGAGFKKDMFTQEEYDAEQIRDAFCKVIDLYGFTGWKVEIDEHTLAIDVRDKTSSGESVIVIPSDRKMSGPKLCEIIGHEIECHLRDSENSRAFWDTVLVDEYKPLIPILAKSDDELFYEGHAKVNDVKVLGKKALPMPDYILTIESAMKAHSYNQIIAEFVRLGLNKGKTEDKALDRAWINCKRMFRGCVDTENSLGYAYTKDRAYFEGYHIVKNFGVIEFATMSMQDVFDLQDVGYAMIPKYDDLELCLHPERLGLLR